MIIIYFMTMVGETYPRPVIYYEVHGVEKIPKCTTG